MALRALCDVQRSCLPVEQHCAHLRSAAVSLRWWSGSRRRRRRPQRRLTTAGYDRLAQEAPASVTAALMRVRFRARGISIAKVFGALWLVYGGGSIAPQSRRSARRAQALCHSPEPFARAIRASLVVVRDRQPYLL